MVGGEQIDAVKAGRLTALRCAGKALNDFFDLARSHRMAAVRIVVGGKARRSPVWHERQIRVTVLTDVIQLLQYGGAVGMYRLGNFTEMRDDRVVAVAKVTAGQYCGGVYRHRFDYDHCSTAARAFFVVAAMALARQTHIGHVGGMSTEYDAIVEFAMTQVEWLENIGIVSHGVLRYQVNTLANTKYNHCIAMNKTIYFHDFHRMLSY
jgi:hypothetical protein